MREGEVSSFRVGMDTYFSLLPLRCILGFVIWANAVANSSAPSNNAQSMPVGGAQKSRHVGCRSSSGKK